MRISWDAFMVPLQTTLNRIVAFLPRLLVGLVLFLVFFLVATAVRRLGFRLLGRLPNLHWALRLLVVRAIYLFILLLGLIVALSAANIDVTTVLTSLGVAGFALGFALKDILENFIAGILLLFARPFEIGDQVMLGTFEGIVTDIQLRTTTIRAYNGDIISIPNSNVFTNPVVNHSRQGRRCYSIEFQTGLKTDLEKVRNEALRAVQENSGVLKDPAPSVRVQKIDTGGDAISWRINYWAAPDKTIEFTTISTTIENLKRALFDAGVPVPSTGNNIINIEPQAPAAAKDAASNGTAQTS